jgi:hypothetical protein
MNREPRCSGHDEVGKEEEFSHSNNIAKLFGTPKGWRSEMFLHDHEVITNLKDNKFRDQDDILFCSTCVNSSHLDATRIRLSRLLCELIQRASLSIELANIFPGIRARRELDSGASQLRVIIMVIIGEE